MSEFGRSEIARIIDLGRQTAPDVAQSISNAIALESGSGLAELDFMLTQSAEPLPAINVSVHNGHGAVLLPEVWIGFAKTEPGRGLEAAGRLERDRSKRLRQRAGLTVPLIRDTLSTANFHLSGDHGDEPEKPASYWQQWYSDRYVSHVAGQEPTVTDIGGDADAVGDELITTWLDAEPPFNLPTVLFDVEQGWASTMPLHLWRDNRDRQIIAVGERSAAMTLRGLIKALVPEGRPPILDPLHDMVTTVADTIEVEL